MSDVKINKSALTFEEFEKMCTEAGISSDNKAEMEKDFMLGGALADVVTEVEMATERFPPMNSAHEGFAVLKEEVDELWDQVAAMAIRFIADVCTETVAQN